MVETKVGDSVTHPFRLFTLLESFPGACQYRTDIVSSKHLRFKQADDTADEESTFARITWNDAGDVCVWVNLQWPHVPFRTLIYNGGE